MAEVAVATALGLIQIIIPQLSNLNLHTDVDEDIRRMRSWLRSMQAFMEDTDGRHRSRTQLDLLDKVGKIAYDIEDVVDDFVLHSPPYTFHHHNFSRTIHTMAHNLYHRFPHRRLSERIAAVRKDIDDIKDQTAVFGHSSPSDSGRRPSSSLTNRVAASPLLLDDEMVGYDNVKTVIIQKLLDHRERRLVRIGVDGPPGSGKTTLVKNVFWKRGIQAQFDCHAWICVSHDPDVEKISRNLLNQFCSLRKEAYPVDDGSNLLRTYLTGKKFLIVVGDVWRQEDWIYLRHSLPDSFRGSRVIVTTRNSNLFSVSGRPSSHDHIVSLRGLESLDSWKLFCRKAFPERECPSELKDVSTSIMKRCEGLPLAIVAVAGALAQKPQNVYEWERFHSNFGNEIQSSSDLSPINLSLLRSYMDLSSNLKRCFLYMSIFPEDHSVERGRLIRLWVAECFAVGTDYRTAEEVAEGYLNELIQRNLILVSNRDFDGRPRSCRVLNLVLKFIIQKSKDENFASVFPKENTTQNHQSKMIRRLSVHDHYKHLPGDDGFAGVRSMFLLRLQEGGMDSLDTKFVKTLLKLKLIKVLDVQGAPLRVFPTEMTRFTLMRYLSFRDTNIKLIPASIEKLSYLETLDLKQTDVTELPQEISNLHNLRHLFAYKYNVTDYVAFDSARGVKLHEGISTLTNLQNLSMVKIGRKGRILKDLKALTQLRKLGVTSLRREHGKDLCAALEAMQSIKTLDISSVTEEELIEVEDMRNPPRNLERLYLKGRLKKIPSWISQLDYLVRIGLKWSKLNESPLRVLGCLPGLIELHMVDCFTGDGLVFEAGGFEKLEILVMEGLSNVNTVVIERGSMPQVKKISLRRCRKLTMLLGVTKELVKLEELTMYDMKEEFVARLSVNGEDREYIENIPLIHSFTLRDRSWSFRNLSGPVSFSS